MRKLVGGRRLTVEQTRRLPFFHRRISHQQAQRYASLLQAESARASDDLVRFRIAPGPVPLPILVVGSRADDLFGDAELRFTAGHYEAELVILPCECHDLMLDPEWQASAQVIHEWLRVRFPLLQEGA